MTIPGCGAYNSSKYALKGFAETMRTEFRPYNVNVHLFTPGSILTPGFDKENEIKHPITKEIEGTGGMTSEDCAKAALAGINRNEFVIQNEAWFNIITPTTNGVTDRPFFFDFFFAPLSVLITTIIHILVNSKMTKWKDFSKEKKN